MWNIYMYELSNGKVPVIDFIESINDIKLKAKTIRTIDLLADFGLNLRLPHSKQINDKRGSMFELRIQQSSNIVRIFYFFYQKENIILLNGFIKKDNKTPRNHIDKAYLYKKDFLEKGEI